jgi:hypothetical protein
MLMAALFTPWILTAICFAVAKGPCSEDETLQVSIDSLKYGLYKAVDQEVFLGSLIVILVELNSVSEQNVIRRLKLLLFEFFFPSLSISISFS